MMTERERVLSVLRGTPPDRVPWLGDLAYWIPYALKSGVIDSSYAGDGLYRLHRDLGLGFYLQGYFPFEGEAENVDVVRTVTGAGISDDSGKHQLRGGGEKAVPQIHGAVPEKMVPRHQGGGKGFRGKQSLNLKCL